MWACVCALSTDSELELVSSLDVDVFQTFLHGQSKQHQLTQVTPTVLKLLKTQTHTHTIRDENDITTRCNRRTHLFIRWEAWSCHVGAADGFYLLHFLEVTFLQQLQKQTNLLNCLPLFLCVWLRVYMCVWGTSSKSLMIWLRRRRHSTCWWTSSFCS